MKMNVQIGDTVFTATLEENAATDPLVKLLQNEPITVSLRDYAGNEKVGSLGHKLPTNDQHTTTHSGDIVLYCGTDIVMFYGSNSWSYTRLAKIDDLSNWKKALGHGSIKATLSL